MATVTVTPQRGILRRPMATTGFWSWFTTVDHKKIGILYGISSFLFFVIGGCEALLIRSQLAKPSNTLLNADQYNQIFTMHGLTMIFLFVMPMSAAFFNYLIPLMIGARDVAFPRLNAFSFWVFILGGLFLYSSWFLGEAPEIDNALYRPGFGPGSGARDIGDSAVLELVGLGGAAAAGSPAVAAFLGGTMADAAEVTENMTDICHGTSSRFKLPTLDMRGTPVGVDVRLVTKLGSTPKVNTGILHVSDGAGQVGAGVATAPLDCFTDAALDLARRLT